ncbi:MAG TPA: cysteine--tRNA ligase [Deltaproteobacteria bacterium]|nr:cysteine--tRNA ligase [Deltaproteobacteria bacterium]
MSIEIYNTPYKKKQEFVPLFGNKVGMYGCGVTVYDMSHIGHARTMIVFDIMARYLRHKGYDLTFVRNFTDVDDKIIARANAEGVSSRELAERYIEEFTKDMQVLKMRPADIEPKATEHIREIIEMVRILIDKGMAYEADESVYFRVGRFHAYGVLSGRRTEDMLAGARVEVGEHKENPLDFALWKSSKPGEPWWDSPWGKGRPGWHIECSAMSTHYLGPTLDIHGGAKDLIFPHHENEIAQSEAVYGVPFVRYWAHAGFLTIEGEKMSKSLGNFITIRELTKDTHPEIIRLLMVSSHYRSPIDYSHAAVDASRAGLVRFYEMLDRVNHAQETATAPRLAPLFETFTAAFDDAMADDFNTARAIAEVHTLTTGVNKVLDQGQAVHPDDRRAMQGFVTLISDVLGILEDDPAVFLEQMKHSGVSATGLSETEITELIAERAAARKAKDFKRSDEIRDMLKAKGIQLKDTPSGTTWEKS